MSTLTSKNKLTLWLDRDAIAFGKAEAKRHRKSLSAMFIEFIQDLRKSQKPQKLSPRIKRLKGVLKGKTTGKEDYYHYLEKNIWAMDKLLIDINIVLDVVLDREVDGSSAAIMNLIDDGKARGLLSATSYTTIYYLTNKYLDHRKAINVIKDLLAILQVSAVDEKILTLALNERGPDFEDNIQIVCARSAKTDYIITRNLSHFKYSSTKALSPTEYLKKLAQGPAA